MAGRQTNTENVMKQIDAMDELDGSDYGDGPIVETGDEDEDEENNDGSGVVEPDEGEDEELVAKPAKSNREAADEPGKKAETAKPATTDEKAEGQFRKQGTNYVDSKNNIVDPRTGQVIAKAGTERRLYEKTQRLSTVLDERSNRLMKYEKDAQDSNTYFGMVKQAGLNMDEIGEAFNIAIKFKSDPIAAAKMVLANVLALGHNVTDILGADAGNAIEMTGVAKMIDQRLAPITQPLQQQREQSAREQRAEADFAKWVNDNEHADIHLQAIDKLIGEHPDLSPQKAYNQLLLFANKHGLDFSKPLGPQVIAKASARNQNPGGKPRAVKPFPDGSSVSPRSLDDGKFADSNASWSDIIGSVIPR